MQPTIEQHYELAERVTRLEATTGGNGHSPHDGHDLRLRALETQVALQQARIDAMGKGIGAILMVVVLELLRGFLKS